MGEDRIAGSGQLVGSNYLGWSLDAMQCRSHSMRCKKLNCKACFCTHTFVQIALISISIAHVSIQMANVLDDRMTIKNKTNFCQ